MPKGIISKEDSTRPPKTLNPLIYYAILICHCLSKPEQRTTPMKIVLINPALEMDNACWFPIGIGYVAAILRDAGFKVELIDILGEGLTRQAFQDRIASVKADAFGLGGIVTAFNNVVDTAAYIRKAHPNALIFAGNTVAYSIPEILLRNSEISVVVLGEGETTTLELIKAMQEGKPLSTIPGLMFKTPSGELINTGERPPIEEIDTLPFPAWDLMPLERYFKNVKARYCVISTVRGCPFTCTYCCKTFMGYKIRYRTPSSIIKELLAFQGRYGMDVFYFFDDLSTINKKRMMEFCFLKMGSSLKKVPWTISARVNLVDEEMIMALKEAGCAQIGFGLESVDQGILDSINKRVTVDQIKQAISWGDKHGLDCGSSSFMIGYINETEKEIKESSEFCKRHYLRYEPQFMTPCPGTELYRYAREKGLIKDELEYIKRLAKQGNTSHLLVNLTKNMSDQELIELREKYLFFTSPYRVNGRLSIKRIIEKIMKLASLPPHLLVETITRKIKEFAGIRTTGAGGSAVISRRDSNIWT